MPSFIVTCYAMFGQYSWEACSFLKRNGGGVDLGKRGDKGRELERLEVEKIVVGIYCMREE